MINVLTYVGMGLQSEVCLWTLLGLLRTIFDATLFKVNANLKQVWQMSMPVELSLPVQRVLRTMISGIMLVQCFTVYVYLASYIVLLYPVFLEERPTLLLPWLLLAAIRKLLCELTSLALGLGTCVLLGAARPPCIKFVVIKVISIMPSFYVWMLVYSYYHALKVASVFKTFPAVLPSSEHDYGLELAIRRRRAKSLLGEDQLRKCLISNLYSATPAITNTDTLRFKAEYGSRMSHATDTSAEDVKENITAEENPRDSDNAPVCYEDWLGSEVMIPRDTDRILEQFGVMMLRIGAFLTKQGMDTNNSEIFNTPSTFTDYKRAHLNCTAMPPDNADTPPLVANSGAKTASYLRDYPHIFQKKADVSLSLGRDNSANPSASQRYKNHDDDTSSIYHKWPNSLSSDGSTPVDNTSSKKSQINVLQQSGFTQDKVSQKSVNFSENKKYASESEVETAICDRISDPTESLELSATSSKNILKPMKKGKNSRQRSKNEEQLNEDETKSKTKETHSNQTLNESEIKMSSMTCLKPNDEERDINIEDDPTSTERMKKKTQENNKNNTE